jgi:CelD/BcsL family acetyltransferase involved in cellulose biosynthesis
LSQWFGEDERVTLEPMAAELNGPNDHDERALDDMLRAHDQLRRTYRRFLCTVFVAFSGFASSVAKRIVDHDDNESFGVVILLSFVATVLGALDAREARLLHGRMRSLRYR